MSLTIRERGQKVFNCLQKEGAKTIRAIAKTTGLSKSSVGRHQQAIARRHQHPESSWWETPEGGHWLKLLVYGVVYYFGIKQGIGAESLSEFLKANALGASCGLFGNCLAQQEAKNERGNSCLPKSPRRALSTVVRSGHRRGRRRNLL